MIHVLTQCSSFHADAQKLCGDATPRPQPSPGILTVPSSFSPARSILSIFSWCEETLSAYSMKLYHWLEVRMIPDNKSEMKKIISIVRLVKEWSVKSHRHFSAHIHWLLSLDFHWFHPCCRRCPHHHHHHQLQGKTHFQLYDTQPFRFMGWVTWFTIFFNMCSLHVLKVNALKCVSMHLSKLIRWERAVCKDKAALLYLPEQGIKVAAPNAWFSITNERNRAFRHWVHTSHEQIILNNDWIIADVQCVPCWTRIMGIKSPTILPTESSFWVLERSMHSTPPFYQISSIAAASRSTILLGFEWMKHWWQCNGR